MSGFMTYVRLGWLLGTCFASWSTNTNGVQREEGKEELEKSSQSEEARERLDFLGASQGVACEYC